MIKIRHLFKNVKMPKLDRRGWLVVGGGALGLFLVGSAVYIATHRSVLSQPKIALRDQARELTANKKYTEAEKIYQGLILVSGNDEAMWREVAFVYQLDNKRAEALKAYEKIIELNPNDAMSYNILGNLYRDASQYEKAEVAYNKSLALNPSLEIAKVNLSHLKNLQRK